jgi:hypothetical protein
MELMYTVYDCKSETYSKPSYHLAPGDAIRAFATAANEKTQSMIGKHPEDFSMFEIGSWDPRTGKIELWESRKHIANAIDLVESETQDLPNLREA